jgi:hypothetical protein
MKGKGGQSLFDAIDQKNGPSRSLSGTLNAMQHEDRLLFQKLPDIQCSAWSNEMSANG